MLITPTLVTPQLTITMLITLTLVTPQLTPVIEEEDQATELDTTEHSEG